MAFEIERSFGDIPSPSYILDEKLLEKNLQLLSQIKQESGVEILLALKAFAMWDTFPLIAKYLDGASASSLHEAMLSAEYINKKTYTYSPAYIESEFEDIQKVTDKITFNSISQWEKYKSKLRKDISSGIRINPEHSEAGVELYDPCAVGSRLGVLSSQIESLPKGIEGIHIHNLCESDSYALERTFKSLEVNAQGLLASAKWINLGGGHLITKKDYNVSHLVSLVKYINKEYGLKVILEPGSAIAFDTGYLVSTVLDIHKNGETKTAILDISFTAHLPDCLEMPYQPEILELGHENEGQYRYRLGGISCLAGDYLQEYTFNHKLKVNDKIVFKDMIHYTMVKTTHFNGIGHPNLCIMDKNKKLRVVKSFKYEDYKLRLS